MRDTAYAFIFVFLCVIVQHNVTFAKRILIITHLPNYSHQIMYRGLVLELNKRGHEIVWVTTHPMKNSSLTNYREIDLSYFYKYFFEDDPEITQFLGSHNNYIRLSMDTSYVETEKIQWSVLHILNRKVFENSEMQKLYAVDSGEHFDVVIVGQGPTISLNAFAYRFNAPLIGISSLDVYNNMRYMLGSMILPSHISNWQIDSPVEDNMSFWRRLINFYSTWMHMYHWTSVHAPQEDAIARKHLGDNIPYIDDITRNMSIYLINKHPLLSHSRPEQSNIIFYNGFHIAKVPPALPEDLKQFLDGAKDGFIYVSFGSSVDWKLLPNNMFMKFVAALSKLPYRILWKIDPDMLPSKFNNIMTSKWLPQQGILAHSNIKLFIYQGGMQSTEETVYYGVPIIGCPVIWDQAHNVQIMVRWGVGLHLQHSTISEESIQAAVHEVINNKRYKNQMMQLSRRYKDRPYDSLQNAISWIEYVMRQNGTSFLRDGLGDKPWHQRYDWDIIGFLAVAAFVASLISLYVLFQILRFVYSYCKILCDNSKYIRAKME